ncbi:hypothetical protein [Pseudoduganella umbonata]|uniref:DUF2188 domain-containing protein n=1 Tax=Pseudoduganella umbonata TaxID=864828 RepID=A0A4P8HL42_9BURK|nr:hypothetical protein [Pseudoduganella umbonata]MBB3221679.1 hypothetical protein [Pseudoduganella umbonata]QCP09094.1 hypothetical protein FCL38_00565 [Pseudoduganella umbonata]
MNTTSKYNVEIAANPPDLPAGWTLRVRDDAGEVASGVFFVDQSGPDQLGAAQAAFRQAERFALSWLAAH